MLFLFLESVGGIPVHPLAAHAAVVLVPLAALAFAALLWRRGWRVVYGIPVAALAVAGAVAAWATRSSGEPLEDSVKDAARAAGMRARFGDHPEQGDAAFLWAALFALAVVVTVALAYAETKRPLPRWLPLAAYAVTLVPAAIAVVAMVAAGHSGAALVWNDVGTFAGSR